MMTSNANDNEDDNMRTMDESFANDNNHEYSFAFPADEESQENNGFLQDNNDNDGNAVLSGSHGDGFSFLQQQDQPEETTIDPSEMTMMMDTNDNNPEEDHDNEHGRVMLRETQFSAFPNSAHDNDNDCFPGNPDGSYPQGSQEAPTGTMDGTDLDGLGGEGEGEGSMMDSHYHHGVSDADNENNDVPAEETVVQQIGGGNITANHHDTTTADKVTATSSNSACPATSSTATTEAPLSRSTAWKEQLKEQVVLDLQGVVEQMESTTKLLLEHVHGYIDNIAQVHESWTAIQEAEHEEATLLEQTEKDVEQHVQFYHHRQ